VRTVVVTCTNGEFGDAPGQIKPGQEGHDEQAVAQLRLSELRPTCGLRLAQSRSAVALTPVARAWSSGLHATF
jgi:hypothetical protein